MKQELLLSALQSLERSTHKDWYNGDVDDWAYYAKQMRSAIDNISPILRIVAQNLETTTVTPTEEPK